MGIFDDEQTLPVGPTTPVTPTELESELNANGFEKMTPEKIAEAVRLYTSGEEPIAAAIARKLNVDPNVVRYQLTKAGVFKKGKTPRKKRVQEEPMVNEQPAAFILKSGNTTVKVVSKYPVIGTEFDRGVIVITL